MEDDIGPLGGVANSGREDLLLPCRENGFSCMSAALLFGDMLEGCESSCKKGCSSDAVRGNGEGKETD